MRGWRRVGRVVAERIEWFEPVRSDSVVQVSVDREGWVMRCGTMRAEDALGELRMNRLRSAIPAIADGDYVWIATALGERAFTREAS